MSAVGSEPATGPRTEPTWRVAVAYSGGRDSTALLHATARMARELGGVEVLALHVHHGLSPQADDWLAHAEAQCASWAANGLPIALRWQRLQLRLAPGDSIEAEARRGRYAALAEMAHAAGCDTVLLAHHRRDQAETFLLQALRGAGVAGLAAMPAEALRSGITWLRPWLRHPRSAIEAYVRQHALQHVDDSSNDERRYARNQLRLDVWPALTQAFGQTEAALAQAAAHQADVLACLENWLAVTLPQVTQPDNAGSASALDVATWRRWAAGPQRELLRAWFRQASGQGLPASWVARLQDEVSESGVGRWPMVLQQGQGVACRGEIVLYRGLLSWRKRLVGEGVGQPAGDGIGVPTSWPLHITALGRWPLPQGLGHLLVSAMDEGPDGEAGLPLASLAACELRLRCGSERFQMAMGRPARSLKKQFQMLALPAWQREGPLLWSGGVLLFVPGLGIHAPARAKTAGPGQVTLRWEPGGFGPISAKG